MKINSEDVKVKIDKDDSKCYSYFACSCKKKDYEYYQSLVLKKFNKQINIASTNMIHSLSCENWEIQGIDCDQWLVIHLKKFNSSDLMRIQCDLLEHGLMAALMIAEDLNNG